MDSNKFTVTDAQSALDQAAVQLAADGQHLAGAGKGSGRAAVVLTVSADNIVVLPAGVSLDDMRAIGRDLVVDGPDGVRYVIPGGAVDVPQIVVDGVTIPPLNLAALLIGNEPQPAAGRPQSSGGNFADPTGPIQDAYALGDLLPYTELQFPRPEHEELFLPIDREPTTEVNSLVQLDDDVLLGGNPGGVGDDADSVNATGILSGSGGDGDLTFALTGAVLPADGGFAIASNNGQTLVISQNGVNVLQVVVNPDTGAYTITQLAPIQHPQGQDENNLDVIVTYTVTDADGDSAAGTLPINIDDDTPVATDDAANLIAGGPSSVTLDVDTNDAPGADGTGSRVFDTLVGVYGTLTLNADGTQTYTLNATGQVAINALADGATLQDVFPYTLIDGDGDGDRAVLTVTLTGVNDPPVVTVDPGNPVGANDMVLESGLPTGSTAGTGHIATGTFTLSDPDGLATLQSVTFNGGSPVAIGSLVGTVIHGAYGDLEITGYNAGTGVATYTYTLTSATVDGPGTESDAFTLTVSDGAASSAPATITIEIVDDVPHAVNDGPYVVTEDAAPNVVSGNVLTNDLHPNGQPGADGKVPAVTWSAGDAAAIAALNTYGTLVQNGDGTWSYTLDNSRAATQALGAGFSQDYVLHYTMQDGDNDPADATLTITVKGADDSASVVTSATLLNPDNTVYEAGLNPSGSEAATSKETDTGSFTVSATDGISTVVIGGTSFTLAQVMAFGTTNGVVDTGEGTLTLTGYSGTGSSGTISYSYTLKATIDNDTKPGATGDHFDDSVTLTVNGAGGTSASDTLVVRIVDDVPSLGPIQDGTANNNPASTVTTGTLHLVGGADGVGTGMVIQYDTTNVTSGGQALHTTQVGNVLYAYTGSGGIGGDGIPTTGLVFLLTVNPGTDQYTFDLRAPLDGTVTPVEIGSGSAFGSGPSNSIVVADGGHNLVFVTGWRPTGGFTSGEESAWLNGGTPTMSQQSNINGSTNGWGLGNNNFDATPQGSDGGEFLRFDFGALNDYDGAGGYTPPAGQTISNATYVKFSFFNFDVGDKIEFVAHYTDGTTESFVFDNPADPRLVTNGNEKIFTVSAPAGAELAWVDAYEAAGSIKLNLKEIGVRTENVDANLNFTVTIPDGDNDTAQDSFTIHVADGLTPSSAVPIVLDLDGDGVEFSSLAAGVHHDYNGDGLLEATAWVGADDGILAFDANGDGKVSGSGEFVFGGNGLTDLEALAANFDSNGDGVLNAQDAGWAKFGVWQDANQNGAADDGEFHLLSELGITGITLTSDGKAYAAADGDVHVFGTGSYTKSDGSSGMLADAAFATRQTEMAVIAATAGAVLVDASDETPLVPGAPEPEEPQNGVTEPVAETQSIAGENADAPQDAPAATLLADNAQDTASDAPESGFASADDDAPAQIAAAEGSGDDDAASVAANDDDGGDSSAFADAGHADAHQPGDEALMDSLLLLAANDTGEKAPPTPEEVIDAVKGAVDEVVQQASVDHLLDGMLGDAGPHPAAAEAGHGTETALAGLLDQGTGGNAFLFAGADQTPINDDLHAMAAAAAQA